MSQIVNWEYYSSLFNKIAEEDFKKAELKAEKEVCRVIGPIRWAKITEDTYGYEQLKDCICNVMEKMADMENIGAGKGIVSVSNDGYSENYAVQTEEQIRAEMHCLIRSMLSGTGLVGAY